MPDTVKTASDVVVDVPETVTVFCLLRGVTKKSDISKTAPATIRTG